MEKNLPLANVDSMVQQHCVESIEIPSQLIDLLEAWQLVHNNFYGMHKLITRNSGSDNRHEIVVR